MGTTEIVFILVIYLLFFGAKGVPSLAKSLGEGIRHFRSATDEIQREILKSNNEIKTDFRDVKDSIKTSQPKKTQSNTNVAKSSSDPKPESK